MTENKFQSPKNESCLESFIHNWWVPEWHLLKIENYIYNLENFDSFCERTLQSELNDDNNKDSMKDLLMVEIIISVMFLAESLAAITQACVTNPKNIQKYLKEFKATDFYSKVSSMDNDYYAKILSIPQIDLLSDDKREMMLEGIRHLKEVLNEIKEYYFAHLDLFNSYKHGFRIFPFSSFDGDNKIVSVIMYFSPRHKQNETTIIRMDKNPQKPQQLASKIAYIIRIILENHANKLKNPESWEMTIPVKSKDGI